MNQESFRAALWTEGTGLVDMNTLIDPGSGWVLTSAMDVNDAGFVVGSGFFMGVETNFMARPGAIPEPPSLLALGLLPAFLARRRRKRQK